MDGSSNSTLAGAAWSPGDSAALPAAANSTSTHSDAGWSVGVLESSPLVKAAYGVISVTGIVGNLLVCAIMLRVPSLRSSTSYLLVHLSLVDLLSCVMVVPTHLFPEPLPMHGRLGDFVCRFYVSKYPMWTFILVSVVSLVLINLERFVAIVYPLRYKRLFTTRRTFLMIAGAWLFAIGHNSFFFAVYRFTDATGCRYLGFARPAVQFVFAVYHYFVYYSGPLGLMVVTNWKMIRRLRRQIKRLNEQKNRTGREGGNELWQVQAAQELQKTLLSVVITFGILWGPNQTMFFCFLMTAPVDFRRAYYHLGVIAGVCNSCINPLIYTVKNKAFRDGLRRLPGALRPPSRAVGDASVATLSAPISARNNSTGVTR